MASYEVLIISQSVSDLANEIKDFFSVDVVSDIGQARDALVSKAYRAIVVDGLNSSGDLMLACCRDIVALSLPVTPPVVLLTPEYSLDEKIKAFEVGCDDYIDSSMQGDEACARITKSIFHSIANEQLALRLETATETAHTAMADNSDLGANIQFLLAVHDCENLDQLGQQFFNTIERYGLKCSLQMRTEMEVKNMEAHGMAKDLESQLLLQLKDSDRYVDFGRRTILNYDRTSILIRNMPVESPEKYGAIKDNTFCLIQGLNARVLAIEGHCKLESERESLEKLSNEVKDIIGTLKESYQHVMCEIAKGVDLAAARIEDRLPALALLEHDEQFVTECMQTMVENTTRTFNEGLVVDEIFERLEFSVKNTLRSLQSSHQAALTGSKRDTKNDSDDASVELF